MRGSTLAAIMIVILTGVFAWSWSVMGKYPQEDIDRRKTKDEKDKCYKKYSANQNSPNHTFFIRKCPIKQRFSSYFSYGILIVILLLAIPIPKQYKWGFTAEKTTFLRNNNAVIETAISLIIIISLAILIGIFI